VVLADNFSSSVSPFDMKMSFCSVVILIVPSKSSRTSVGKIKGKLSNGELKHATLYPPGAHLHPSGHNLAALARTITNHNQNMTAGVATSSDTNTTVSLDGMSSCCNLHTESNRN
jgi:hypothetical protein